MKVKDTRIHVADVHRHSHRSIVVRIVHRHFEIADAHFGVRVTGDAADREIADTEAQPQIAALRHIDRYIEVVFAGLWSTNGDLGLGAVSGKLADPSVSFLGILLFVRRDHQTKFAGFIGRHY